MAKQPLGAGATMGAAAARYTEPPRPPSSSASGPTGPYIPYADIYGDERQTKNHRDVQRHPLNGGYETPYQSDNPYTRAPYVSDELSITDSHHSRASDDSRRQHRDRDGHRSRNPSRARSSVRDRSRATDEGSDNRYRDEGTRGSKYGDRYADRSDDYHGHRKRHSRHHHNDYYSN